MSRRSSALILAGLLLSGALAVLTTRVLALEEADLEHLGPWRLFPADAPDQRLTQVTLRAGALATFEVCALDPLSPQRWAGALELLVRGDPSGPELVRLPLTEAVLGYATRTDQAACLLLSYDEPIPRSGEYLVEAIRGEAAPEELGRVPLRAHVMARAPVTPLDQALVLIVLFGATLALVSAVRWRQETGDEAAPLSRPLLRAAGAILALVAVAAMAAALPLDGPVGGLAQGALVATAQLALALALVSGAPRAEALALLRPKPAWWALLIALACGLALWSLGDLLGRLIPSTGVAPIQSFVSSPGGVLTLAALAAAAPLAEELFFRGLLFGLLARRLGSGAAFAITSALFVLAHLEQAWGAWGSVSALVVTALTLGALRWWTGSTLASALAHLTHNAVIIALSLSATIPEG